MPGTARVTNPALGRSFAKNLFPTAKLVQALAENGRVFTKLLVFYGKHGVDFSPICVTGKITVGNCSLIMCDDDGIVAGVCKVRAVRASIISTQSTVASPWDWSIPGGNSGFADPDSSTSLWPQASRLPYSVHNRSRHGSRAPYSPRTPRTTSRAELNKASAVR